MEEQKKEPTASGENKKGMRLNKNHVIIGLVIILAAAAIGGYIYNLPEKRLARTLKKADALMAEKQYEQASAEYEKAEGIDGSSHEAMEGHILAELYRADELAAQAVDIPDRSEVCDCYGKVMELCDAAAAQQPADESFAAHRADAEAKRTQILQSIAADYQEVKYVTQKDDRSVSVSLADGKDSLFTHYYDLVQIEDEYYPYAEKINAVLRQQMDDYFADPANEQPADMNSVVTASADTAYRDYVGLDGVYTGKGLMCVRLVHVKTAGDIQTNEYCGLTFRLSDGEQVSLDELTGVADLGLMRKVRRTVWSWIEKEGYANILKADIEDYVEDVDDDAYKYWIRDDGTVCLIVDQTMPFFSNRQEILEIPLELGTD